MDKKSIAQPLKTNFDEVLDNIEHMFYNIYIKHGVPGLNLAILLSAGTHWREQ